jgi:hypothetical protein
MTTPTRIEERAARKIHDAAVDAAKAKGADFWCAQRCGFAATDVPPSIPKVCKVCQKRGVTP